MCLLTVVCSCGSVSFDAYGKGWIGRPIADLRTVQARSQTYGASIGWKETTYVLPNGNVVFVDPVRPRCFVHWETNKGGIIVAYKGEGTNCH
jgi:hypothetical protein